ncbi:DUF998 domain-containing protein [Saccharomonospora xinjiangensis]|uniref:DUF998 domain-containing protein n=1 Tax=Saccharomonospora xinjiangensis XJ-54 TaxID=882086 RepID=I0V1P1_9PSEU|nr:DUF998 domain-containing protein [Saccharomonospora xinjiangensis]EID54044.1 hypothetical protein SacxiDRAFT_1802 [Saccharomonospora xinjiangensis XJ-54]
MGRLGAKGIPDTVPAGTVEFNSARVRTWTFAATAALGWALFTLTVLHLVSSFDPITDPVSRYAFTDSGKGMLEASLLSFAVGVVAVRGALLASGLRLGRTATILFFAAALGLAAAALFPATFTSDIAPVSGLIHQYASLVAFLAVPGVALCVLDQLRDTDESSRGTRRVLVWFTSAAIGLLILFGASYLAGKMALAASSLSSLPALIGSLPEAALQRLVFVVDFALLATLLTLANRTAISRAGRG